MDRTTLIIIAVVLFLLGIYYYAQWKSYKAEQEKKPWPPATNPCPDYFISLGNNKCQNIHQIGTCGINGRGLKTIGDRVKWTVNHNGGMPNICADTPAHGPLVFEGIIDNIVGANASLTFLSVQNMNPSSGCTTNGIWKGSDHNEDWNKMYLGSTHKPGTYYQGGLIPKLIPLSQLQASETTDQNIVDFSGSLFTGKKGNQNKCHWSKECKAPWEGISNLC